MKRFSFGALSCIVISGWLLLSSAQGAALAQSSLSFGNLRVTPGSGTVKFGDLWTADAFAEAAGASMFDQSVDGVTPAAAFASSSFATAASTSEPRSLTGVANSIVNIPDGIAAASFAAGRSSLFNTFTITGGTGAVPVSFSADLVGSLLVFTDALGVSAKTETIFALELDGDPVLFRDDVLSIGSNSFQSLSVMTTLTGSRTLQFDTSYFVFVQPDSESMAVNSAVPEPATVLSGFFLVGLASLKFIRTRRKISSIPNPE